MDFIGLLFFFIIIVPSAIIHEYAHGLVADLLGDPTARLEGRLTLNPRAHIDPWGTIAMPILLYAISGGGFLFAYAKPVPFNPYNLKDIRWGPALVAIAGPASNLLIALIMGTLVRFLPVSNFTDILSIFVYANVLLAVFNLIPIPPLDGSKILYAVLPAGAERVKEFLERYGLFLILFFVFFAFRLVSPVIWWLYQLLSGRQFLAF